LTPLKDLGRVMRTVTKHSPAKLSVLGEVEGVPIRNEAMLPRGSASSVETGGRLLGSDNRTKGRVLA
jgi:hypothetical protein